MVCPTAADLLSAARARQTRMNETAGGRRQRVCEERELTKRETEERDSMGAAYLKEKAENKKAKRSGRLVALEKKLLLSGAAAVLRGGVSGSVTTGRSSSRTTTKYMCVSCIPVFNLYSFWGVL